MSEDLDTGFPFGLNLYPPADLAGGYVGGPVTGPRHVVAAEPLYRAYHELDAIDPDHEAYSTVYAYPHSEYCDHVARHGSPRGYTGPAACPRLVWDIDRADPVEALEDARRLTRYLIQRYAEDGIGCYFSGGKGYHITLVNPPGYAPSVHTPSIARLICLTVARSAGVTVDPAIYDRQRLLRLPNSRHPRSGHHKRYLDLEALFMLTPEGVCETARHPAGFGLPTLDTVPPQLEADWSDAAARVRTGAPIRGVVDPATGSTPGPRPVVPLSVRELIGMATLPGPGERALRLFSAAAALAEAAATHGVETLIYHLLEETALKCGLSRAELTKQIRDGIAHGLRAGRGVPS